jgi:hypothetical protein
MTEKNLLQEYCQKNKLPFPIYNSWSTGEPHKQQWSSTVTITFGKKNIIMSTIVPSNSKSSAEKQAALIVLDHIKSKKNNDTEKVSQLSKLTQAARTSITSTTSPHKTLFSNKLSDKNKHMIYLNSDTDNSSSLSPTSDTNNDVNDDTNNDISNDIRDDTNNDTNNDIGFIPFENIYLVDLENKPLFKISMKNNCLYIGFINSIHHSLVKYKHWHKCKSDDISKEIFISKNNKIMYLIEGGTVDLVDHFMTALLYPLINFIQEQKNDILVHIISGDHAGWCTRACFEKIIKWKKITNIEITNAATIE